jgi:hypothetical protein
MALLRAFSYFVSEALTSLWRSRLVNAVSIGTITVSLFVLGAFLTVASALSGLVTRWTETVQVIVTGGRVPDGAGEPREPVRGPGRVAELVAEALAGFAGCSDPVSPPEDLNPFPASLEVSLRP